MSGIIIEPPHVEDFIDAVRWLASKYPDAVYIKPENYCLYNFGDVDNGPDGCGCIMGQAARLLNEFNPIKEIIAKTDEKNNDRIRNLIRLHDPDWKIPNDDLQWLSSVQRRQDSGSPWGEAVTQTDIVFGEKNDPQFEY